MRKGYHDVNEFYPEDKEVKTETAISGRNELQVKPTPKKRFISFSGGVESRTLCLIYGGVAKPIFADTGSEHKILYKKLDEFEQKMKECHGEDFEIIKVNNGSLKDYIKKQKFFPSYHARYCTRMFKIEPIDNYLKEQGECELMIGLNADEAEDRTGNYGLLSNVKYSYPLQANGLTRGACIELLKKADIEPNFPPYMQRGGGDVCFFKSKAEWRAFVKLEPKEARELAAFEESIQDKREKYFTIRSDMPPLKRFIQETESQKELFTLDETYNMLDNNHTPCGVFCHR